MLLFQKRFHGGLVDGSITLTFRSWDKPHVKPGGRYRCHPIGVIEVDAVDKVRVGDITEREAVRAGFADLADMLEYMRSGPGGPVTKSSELWRVTLHYGGDGDRVEIALDDDLKAADIDEIRAKLERMDAKRPWTAAARGRATRSR